MNIPIRLFAALLAFGSLGLAAQTPPPLTPPPPSELEPVDHDEVQRHQLQQQLQLETSRCQAMQPTERAACMAQAQGKHNAELERLENTPPHKDDRG